MKLKCKKIKPTYSNAFHWYEIAPFELWVQQSHNVHVVALMERSLDGPPVPANAKLKRCKS